MLVQELYMKAEVFLRDYRFAVRNIEEIVKRQKELNRYTFKTIYQQILCQKDNHHLIILAWCCQQSISNCNKFLRLLFVQIEGIFTIEFIQIFQNVKRCKELQGDINKLWYWYKFDLKSDLKIVIINTQINKYIKNLSNQSSKLVRIVNFHINFNINKYLSSIFQFSDNFISRFDQYYQEMDNKMEQFRRLNDRFNAFKLKNPVPPLMTLKLNFLARAILRQPISENQLKQLGDDEIQLFTGLEQSMKIAMYVSIVQCLIEKQLPLKEIEAQIKQENLLSRWKICFISWNRESFYILRERRESYAFKNLRLFKPSENDKRRVTFGIDVGTRKYLIGLREEKIALDLLIRIRELIRSNSETTNSHTSLQFRQQNKEEELSIADPREQDQIHYMKNELIEGISLNQQSNKKILAESDLGGLEQDFSYRIYEYLQKYEDARILVHNTEANNFKLELMVQRLNGTCEDLLEILTNPKLWNPNILESHIVAKVDHNIFIIYERHRAFGYSYRERDFVFMRWVFKKEQKYYIIEKSVEHIAYPAYKLVVRGNIKERSLVLKAVKETTLVICKVEIDFGGYNGIQHNKNMALKYLKDFCEFKTYCRFKDLKQDLQNCTKLYNFDKKWNILVKESKQKENKRQNQKINLQNSKTSQDSVNNINKSDSKQQLQKYHEVPLYYHMPSYLSDQLSLQYLECIHKNQHHLLPLKHFDPQKQRKDFSKKQSIDPSNDFILQGGQWEINEDGEFVYKNQKVMNAQKDVLGYLLRQIGSQIMKGQSIMNISLPVDIFQGRSLLERCANSFCYAPIYLTEAGKKAQQIEQIELVVLFFLSINSLELKIEKPFNPILGQTFQCFIGNIPFYVEQISHHPPISAYYMKSKQFILYGNSMLYAELGLNKGFGGNAGIINIVFPINNAHYQCICPSSEMAGIVFGDRILRPINKGYIINKEKKLYFQVSYGKDKKDIYEAKEKMRPSSIEGGIFRVNGEFIKKFEQCKVKHKFEGLTKKDAFHKLARVSGVYYDKIYINQKQIKSIYDPIPYCLQYQRHPLPSNSNFRQDIIYVRRHELAIAQSWKEKLEHLQRSDKKKRAKQ